VDCTREEEKKKGADDSFCIASLGKFGKHSLVEGGGGKDRELFIRTTRTIRNLDLPNKVNSNQFQGGKGNNN